MRIEVALAAVLLVVATANAEQLPEAESAGAPYRVRVRAERAQVRSSPGRDAQMLGLLVRGDTVTVRTCLPSCTDPDAWASLEPAGYVRVAQLGIDEGEPDEGASAIDREVGYARVLRERALVYARPERSAPRIGTLRLGDEIALRPGTAGSDFYEHVRGGFVSARDLRMLTPSSFEGVHGPAGSVVFARRETSLAADDGTSVTVAKHSALRFVGFDGARVRVEGGSVPRAHVRVARPRVRPPDVRADELWVHVDLREQVLTAYEGDSWLFATLVSTGRAEHPTRAGHYRVTWKSVHDDMHGPPGDPYTAEEVPSVMYFHKGMALHGAYWHDVFGTPASHGCVNMSPRDAAWVFAWSPPAVPQGWHAVVATPGRTRTLRVIVERQ